MLTEIQRAPGLMVWVGSPSEDVSAQLVHAPSSVVQQLVGSGDKLALARARWFAGGQYGRQSARVIVGKRLPYADNLVNVVLAFEPELTTHQEILRVLAPRGVAYVRHDGQWTRAEKTPRDGTDAWTHYLYDASGNPVSHDLIVSPPRTVQWVAGPRYARSHEHLPTINAVVSAEGRLFYIVDEGATSSVREPGRWSLVARDAYNGCLLWRRPLESWYPVVINWGATPRELQRKLIAVGDRVYATLGLYAPLCALDARSGETLQVYEGTDGADEIILHDGVLLAAVRQVTGERVSELARWAELSVQDGSPLFERDEAQPLVNRLRTLENQTPRALVALEADSGRVLWRKTGDEVKGLRALSLCASGQRVCYYKQGRTVCVDLPTGRESWSVTSPALRLVHGDSVLCANAATVERRTLATGEIQWAKPTQLTQVQDVFVIGDSVWVGGFKPFPEKRGPSWGPYFVTQLDLDSGQQLCHLEPENPGHHHRCFLNKATDRYILGGRRGTEFIDLGTGDVLWNSWVRGVCKYGVMPANGLLYSPPNACGCYVAVKLAGFYALSGEAYAAVDGAEAPGVLETGPALEGSGDAATDTAAQTDAWPTYRRDAARSGCTQEHVASQPQLRWTAHPGGSLSSVTVADGRLMVAAVDQHTVHALDPDTGLPLWQFTADARVDSPPTLYEGRALFGARDGSVYSVRASDGQLAWRLHTARNPRQVLVDGQLEAASPVHGSVLVQDDVAFVTSGRSTYLDGGVELYRIRPQSGEVLSRTPFFSPDPETGRQPPHLAPAFMPGQRNDLLSSDGQHVYLRDQVFDRQGQMQAAGDPHLLTLTGFLDDAWSHRSYWIFGTHCSLATGCSGRDRNLIYGRLLVFDEHTVYGYGRANVHWSNQLQDGPYRLFARPRDAAEPTWQLAVPIQVRALVLAGEHLLAAGPAVDPQDIHKPMPPDRPSWLLVLSAADGKLVGKASLSGSPVLDGMAVAGGRIFLALDNGQLVCWQ